MVLEWYFISCCWGGRGTCGAFVNSCHKLFQAGIEAQRRASQSEKSFSETESETEDRRLRRGPSIHIAAKNNDLERIKLLVGRNADLKE